MVVDDTPANLRLLEQMLQGQGHRVLAFPGGRLALNAARRNPPDLILLDITMPEMNGFEMCQHLKADLALRHIPVLFISALAETADKVRGFEAGGVDFITKPFQFEEVNARVQTHLELVRKLRELQASYTRLRELESLRDSLVHMVVHDMRSPLTVILGNLDLAVMQPLSEKVKGFLGAALQSSLGLMEMVSTLLDVSRIEDGQLNLNLEPVDMAQLAREAVHAVEPLRGERRLVVDAPGVIPCLRGDLQLLQRVLHNLLSNALKYTDSTSGEVRLAISPLEAGVRIEVRDNGPGVPVEFRERVFHKFCQVEARQQRKAHSSGLGLTFCKLAVDLHGGHIGVDSAEGQGSCFWFELPLEPIQAEAPSA